MLKIRLRRMGKKHQPFYRVVVSESRAVPTAPALEELGWFNPQPDPPKAALELDRLKYWVAKGAQLSPTVKKILGQHIAAAKAPIVAAVPAAPVKAKRAPKAAEPAPEPIAAVVADAPEASGAEVAEGAAG